MLCVVPAEKERQPRFHAYCHAVGLGTGDTYKPQEFIFWVQRGLAEYRERRGLSEVATLKSDVEHDRFTEFLLNKGNKEG
ncbi:hypothetical protein [Bacillus cereus]|uniref:hypothetical protein n=1 Tax=Bacillus cereus TaxID=1396 RepID=UPI000BFC8666|nr:hypothetical protein [Bacillus cereus]PGR83572.1 hypothetical protein COC63_06195 [Bacillus cereus]